MVHGGHGYETRRVGKGRAAQEIAENRVCTTVAPSCHQMVNPSRPCSAGVTPVCNVVNAAAVVVGKVDVRGVEAGLVASKKPLQGWQIAGLQVRLQLPVAQGIDDQENDSIDALER